MDTAGVAVAVIVVMVALLLVLGPLAAIVVAVVLLVNARGFRARAAPVRGTVVEARSSVSTEMAAIPTGTGGLTMVGGKRRLRSRPVVTYPGPGGETLTGQVRFSAPGAVAAGQPLDLLVDPARPTEVRIRGAERAPAALRLITIGIMVLVMDAILVGVFVYLLGTG